MLRQLIIVTLLVTNAKAHVPVNSTDVIIYGEHADLPKNDAPIFVATDAPSPTLKTKPISDSDDEFMENKNQGGHRKHGGDEAEVEKEDVVFVPTDSTILRNEDVHDETVRISDILENKKRISSFMKETEAPPADIVFISGKNDERQEKPPRREDRWNGLDNRRNMDYDEEEVGTTTPKVLDCKNLDCENNMESVCGGKLDRSEWKYRLFLNECYFRKVNCAFTYEMNRYKEVDLSFCKTIATHVTRRPEFPYVYYPIPQIESRPRHRTKEKITEQPRRSGAVLRRAMSINIGGTSCGHNCPITCTNEYTPECALSASGERRVFANHCLLDLNSCQLQVIWRRRPLAECVGGKKADMQQNRAFINWMQRVGIVDKKGKLVMS